MFRDVLDTLPDGLQKFVERYCSIYTFVVVHINDFSDAKNPVGAILVRRIESVTHALSWLSKL